MTHTRLSVVKLGIAPNPCAIPTDVVLDTTTVWRDEVKFGVSAETELAVVAVVAVAAFPPILSPAAVPVIFVPTSVEGVPRFGVTNVGLVANTAAPVPVSSVNAAARFALDGVARRVAMFAPRPDTPVATGKPVQLVSVPEVGVPNTGVVIVGLVKVGVISCDPVIGFTTFVPLQYRNI